MARYEKMAIPAGAIPQATEPCWRHVVETYASEINKVASVWEAFAPEDLEYRPDPKSMTVLEIMRHQLLGERRFFGEFLGGRELAPEEVIPPGAPDAGTMARRLTDLALPRLEFIATRSTAWWLEEAAFFDVRRERIWILWRRMFHTAHHRTQLTVYLRLLGKDVVSTYGPTADVSWDGADPTVTVEAAGRQGS
ncbi:MAG: damage-inducible protein DinB [Acidobacteria bacterium]|nr:damage-inducible protein DinB [Acidobacteriota bacterium]